MVIGKLDLGEKPVVLAPMEDVTDIGFRTLCRKMGKLTVNDEERPVAIQIYGKDPGAMAEAAHIVEETSHPDVIDINFGCPVKKIAGKGAGAGLLQNVPLMLDIARRVVAATKTPVTAKTRLGWDMNQIIISTLAEQLQDCGIQALTIHGRTRSQMYKGDANWDFIREVKENPHITIPIIGNGDIDSPEKAQNAFETFRVDAVMVGRATFGRPWIFKEMHDALHPENPVDTTAIIPSQYEPMTPDWKLDVLKEQVRLSIERIDEYRGILHSRRHIAASPLFKCIPDFRQHRIAMLRATTKDELFRLMEETRPLLNDSK